MNPPTQTFTRAMGALTVLFSAMLLLLASSGRADDVMHFSCLSTINQLKTEYRTRIAALEQQVAPEVRRHGEILRGFFMQFTRADLDVINEYSARMSEVQAEQIESKEKANLIENLRTELDSKVHYKTRLANAQSAYANGNCKAAVPAKDSARNATPAILFAEVQLEYVCYHPGFARRLNLKVSAGHFEIQICTFKNPSSAASSAACTSYDTVTHENRGATSLSAIMHPLTQPIYTAIDVSRRDVSPTLELLTVESGFVRKRIDELTPSCRPYYDELYGLGLPDASHVEAAQTEPKATGAPAAAPAAVPAPALAPEAGTNAAQ